MQAIGVIGLTFADVALFPMPPRRPSRSNRRRRSSQPPAIAQAIRRFIADAAQDDDGVIPRLGRYPY